MSKQTECPTAAPAVKGGVVPYLQVDGAMKAADFYTRAFGAVVVASQPPDAQGRTMHVHLHVNGGSVMLSDPFPDHGYPPEPAKGYRLLLPVEDIDAAFARAVEAGATVVTPVAEMFWGDRYGQLRDPFGVLWAMNAPKR